MMVPKFQQNYGHKYHTCYDGSNDQAFNAKLLNNAIHDHNKCPWRAANLNFATAKK